MTDDDTQMKSDYLSRRLKVIKEHTLKSMNPKEVEPFNIINNYLVKTL